MPKKTKAPSEAEASRKPVSPGRPDFAAMEEEILKDWDVKKIFERSVEERPESKPFVFYDGPPFATGLPHYGHLLQSIIKDAVPRYKTMQGYRVRRRWGWDCHGLPAEAIVEKEHGLTSKEEICAFGIEKFTESCRSSVLRYAGEWSKYIRRIGRWVDMEHAYRTMDDSYIESVWWVFSELVKKGHIYEGHRVMMYSPKRATPLSNFEVSMDNAYRDHEDTAITVKFKVVGKDNSYLLAWTTTPWTLISNVALAVNPNLVYVTVKVRDTGEYLTFAESRMSDVLRQYYPLEDPNAFETHHHMPFEIVERHHGEELEGVHYEPLFKFFPVENGHLVVSADYVSDADGTGIVHIAPAFGEEDMEVGRAHKLSLIDALDEGGSFKSEVDFIAGMFYLDANNPIIEHLESRGLLYRKEGYEHSVPYDPRSGDLLIYRALPGWFVDVEGLRPKLKDTAKRIEWHPAHLKDGRFGHGLETAPDWNLSRSRFWGAPLPVWKCDTCRDQQIIIGSLKELEKQATKGSIPEVLDLHRPGIDQITIPCPGCGKPMKRIEDVFDCWFESGSMPYAAEHYPFENRKQFEANFPADFIGEAQDQTRGWFYVLHVLATALFGKPAFKDVIVTGIIMGEDGKKMSKRLKNYPDSWELLSKHGADALRLYLLGSPVVEGEQVNFSENEIDELVRKYNNLLWNVKIFYETYAADETVEIGKPRSADVLDRWLFARMHALMREVTEAFESYDIARAARPLRGFVDDLSTWWLRRSRDRIRGSDTFMRMDALKTLREVLLDFSMLVAPITPFIAERMYRDMGGMKASVHLEKYPKADVRLIDERLLQDMHWVRMVVSRGQERRAEAKIPIRQALASLSITIKDAHDAERLSGRSDLLDLIREELNVLAVHISKGEEDGIVVLDTVITPELKRMGLERELIRQFMNLRKERGLKPQDHIDAHIATSHKEILSILKDRGTEIQKLIRADALSVEDDIKSKDASRFTLDGEEVVIDL